MAGLLKRTHEDMDQATQLQTKLSSRELFSGYLAEVPRFQRPNVVPGSGKTEEQLCFGGKEGARRIKQKIETMWKTGFYPVPAIEREQFFVLFCTDKEIKRRLNELAQVLGHVPRHIEGPMYHYAKSLSYDDIDFTQKTSEELVSSKKRKRGTFESPSAMRLSGKAAACSLKQFIEESFGDYPLHLRERLFRVCANDRESKRDLAQLAQILGGLQRCYAPYVYDYVLAAEYADV